MGIADQSNVRANMEFCKSLSLYYTKMCYKISQSAMGYHIHLMCWPLNNTPKQEEYFRSRSGFFLHYFGRWKVGSPRSRLMSLALSQNDTVFLEREGPKAKLLLLL
jgi:hypothetical protein